MMFFEKPNYIFAMRVIFSITLLFVLYCAFAPVSITRSVAEISTILHVPVASTASNIVATTPFHWPVAQAGHIAAFAVLAVQSAMAFPLIKTRFLALGLLALGISIEIVQGISAFGRTPEMQDVFGDIAGISFGFAAVYLIRVLRFKLFNAAVKKPAIS